MNYLFSGNDIPAKDEQITEIKKKIFSSRPDAFKFDYELLDGQDLDRDELKKSLLSLPAIALKRLVFIRNVHKLDSHCQKIILEFVQSREERTCLVLDTNENDLKNQFFVQLSRHVKLVQCQTGKKENVFDVTNAIAGRNPVEAFQVLSRLLEEGSHPLQVMGGIVWFWGTMRNRLTKEKFEKGLWALQEADVNIKRSRIKPEYAVEILVAKLGSLLAG